MDEKEKIRSVLNRYDQDVKNDKQIMALQNKIRKGKGTYTDASTLASRTGIHAGKAAAEGLSNAAVDGKVSKELAGAILRSALNHNRDVVVEAAQQVQESLNRAAGLGLKPVIPEINSDRVNGLIKEVSGKDDFPEFAKAFVQQVENLSMSIVDDAVRENANFHYESGLAPVVHRIAESGCCKWCDLLAGTYDYSKVNNTGNDVFRRHNNCRCQVIFDPRKSGKRSQNVHSKKILSAREAEELDARRMAGLSRRSKTPQERNLEAAIFNQAIERSSDLLANAIIDNHEVLKYYEPKEMHQLLQQAGYQVTPLGTGSLKDKPFSQGGGFRIHFGNDGYFQYHPEEKSHHGDAYWKICTGKIGIRRYNLDGIEEVD